MKHPSAYYLLLLYAFAICKPFLPVVSDALAHAFWEKGHFETVHQHHGKNHLHDELKEAARQDSADTNANKNSEPVSVHLPLHYHYDFSNKMPALQNPFAGSCSIISPFLERHTPPPKA